MPNFNRKIDDRELYRMLVEEGRSQQECANHFGVTHAAVSKRVRVLNIELNRHVGLERAADVCDRGLNVIQQLQATNDIINEELAWAVEEARKEGSNRRALERTIVELSAEVRKQLRLGTEILRSLYDMKGVREFQQQVISAIAEVSPDVRDAILQKLREKRAIRTATSFVE